MAIRLKRFLSLGMLGPKESDAVKATRDFFDFIMLLVMFWLPLQWYLEAKHRLSFEFIHVANWTVWCLFVLEIVVMTLIVKRKWYYLSNSWLNLIIIVAVFPPLWIVNNTYFEYVKHCV